MSSRRSATSYLAAVVLALLGCVGGATGAALVKRNKRAEPWRALRIDHEGVTGRSTRTRVIFDDPKLPLQGVEVLRDPQGKPELAHVEVRGQNTELTVLFERGKPPSSLQAADGSQAVFTYKGAKVRVVLLDKNGKELGNEVLRVPVAQQIPLRMSQRSTLLDSGTRTAAASLNWLVGEAHAQTPPKKTATGKTAAPAKQTAPAEDPQVNVKRDLQMVLDVRMPGKNAQPGQAQLEANCAPFTCLPQPSNIEIPGERHVRIEVSAATVQSKLPVKPTPEAMAPFVLTAEKERNTSLKVLRDIEAVVAIVGVTARVCKDLKLNLPLCVSGLRRDYTVGAAIHAIDSYEPASGKLILEGRAKALFYEEQARAMLDQEVAIEVCVNRDGHSSACTKLKGRPLGASAMTPVRRVLEVRKGIAGALAGSFELLQNDGSGCNFSPSPKTSGPLRLNFDGKTGEVTAKFSSDMRGTRSSLRCNLGSGDMRWTQKYSATLKQQFTPEQLQTGGILPLKLVGTMSGSGSASQSNCRTNSGASVGCPAGRKSSYTYGIELTGSLDMQTKLGSGRLVVTKAPLRTRGQWRVPAKANP